MRKDPTPHDGSSTVPNSVQRAGSLSTFALAIGQRSERKPYHELNDLDRSEVLAKLLLITERVGEELAEDVVEDVDAAGAADRAGRLHGVQPLEAINDLVSQSFLLRLQPQREVARRHLVRERCRQVATVSLVNEHGMTRCLSCLKPH